MVNPLTLAILGGSVAGGYLGYRTIRNDEAIDSSHRAGLVTASSAFGGVVGAGASYVGFKNLAKGAAFAGSVSAKSAYKASKRVASNPTIRKAMNSLDTKSFGIPSSMAGPAGLLALTAVAGGYLGYRAVRNDETMDRSDKAGSTLMSAALGGVVGVGASYIGFKNIAKGVTLASSLGVKTAQGASKILTANPMRTAMRGLGRESFGLPSALKGPLGLLALTAISIGAVAAGSKNRVGVEYEHQAHREDFGYDAVQESPKVLESTRNGDFHHARSIKERAQALKAKGSMIFGLHNKRHG